MKREFLDYVDDVIDAMSKAQEFTAGMDFRKFSRDGKTVFAVTRAIEIIGEAVKKIPSPVKKHYPQVPWKEMAGMRDKLIHEYFGVNLRAVWDTIKKDIPAIKPTFEKIKEDYQRKTTP